MDLTVAVIAKECLPGRVKTRMTPPLSPSQAAQLAQVSLARTLDTARSLPAAHRLLVMDGTPRRRDAKGFRVIGQAPGTLDERLAAFCDLAARPVLILGMDTPQFSPKHIAALLTDWSTPVPLHDAWLGLAMDGGFWALALRRPQGHLVRGVPMSTDTTGSRQLTRLALHGLSTGLLPTLQDMDFFSDAVAIAAGIPGTDFASMVFAISAQLAASGQLETEPTVPSPGQNWIGGRR
ncbi:DUF2064 domain-containing protein [Arthrobacter sp. ISL-28]|uniref:TIGR04282 family arsenosugar biosynthesis glycosyltransferase n=1 Tax=Arthrobacter sp. ISL-28 TaxID=2819108 RepID=UPI001BE953A9|nr:DUF2064 domain-containing protein [Arthrobacter sp. ISL-28]MBT2519875.1 DUF2064 domain-containing protein [Arthrobacter sp. ISL-28]